MSWEDWEGLAREFHDATGVGDPPVDAFIVARRAQLAVEYSVGPNSLDLERRVIRIRPVVHPRVLHVEVAHEVGHALLDRAGLPQSETGAKYLSGALLGPRQHIDRDLRESGWSISALQSKHLHMPALALALRITQVRDAIATIFDPRGELRPWRRASPWIEDPRITASKPSALERDFAARTWEARADLVGEGCEGGLFAHLVLDEYEDGPRVIVVRDLRQLAFRFSEV